MINVVEMSESIADLAKALVTAQGQIEGAEKNSTNPHFRSKYADLGAVWDSCRAILQKNKLCVVQMPSSDGGKSVTITTMLIHESGQFIRSSLTMTSVQHTPQGIGSCITYARRYSLMSVLGIAPEDDDGNAATTGNRVTQNRPVNRQQSPVANVSLPQAISPAQIKRLFALLDQSKFSPEQMKEYMIKTWKVDSSKNLSPEQYNLMVNLLEANKKDAG